MRTPTTPPPAPPGSPAYFEQARDAMRPGLNPLMRVVLVVIAVAGTVAYGTHAHQRFAEAGLAWLGPGIAWGAGAAWVALAAGALATVDSVARLRRLADHALVTLSLGMVGVLTALAATTATDAPPLATHLALLGVSNVAMGAYFVAAGPRAGLPRRVAALLWVLAMNGVLAVGVAASFWMGGAA